MASRMGRRVQMAWADRRSACVSCAVAFSSSRAVWRVSTRLSVMSGICFEAREWAWDKR